LACTAVAGSRAGTGGISISPAPRLPLVVRRPDDRVRLVPLPLPVPRLPVLPLPDVPLPVFPLPDVPLPDVPLPVLPLPVPPADGTDPAPGVAGRRPAVPGPLALPGPLLEPLALPEPVVLPGPLATLGPLTSAKPQTLQYPPSMVPPQPGWAQGVPTAVMLAPVGRSGGG
jgi:hypothetical protein